MSKKKYFELLTEKPWETDQIAADNEHQGQTVNLNKQKLGLRTIMAASTVLFSLFVVAYSDRMLISDWRNMPEPWLLWINTVILIISSIVFHSTAKYAKKEIYDKTKKRFIFYWFSCLLIFNRPINSMVPINEAYWILCNKQCR